MAHQKKLGGRPAAPSAAVLAETEIVLTSVPSAAALAQVVEELAQTPQPGRIVTETSTLALSDKQAAHDRLAAALQGGYRARHGPAGHGRDLGAAAAHGGP